MQKLYKMVTLFCSYTHPISFFLIDTSDYMFKGKALQIVDGDRQWSFDKYNLLEPSMQTFSLQQS